MSRRFAIVLPAVLLLPGLLHPEMPAKDFSHEIDEALANYVNGIRATKDHDEEKIRKIFSNGYGEDEILQEEEVVRFNNVGTPAIHVVQKGETLFAIARRYGIAPAELVKHNAFLNDRALFVGDRLSLSGERKAAPSGANAPATRNPSVKLKTVANAWKKKDVVTYRTKKYTAKKGESITSIARKHKLSVAELCRLNDMKKTDRIHPDKVLVVQKIRSTQHIKVRQFFLQPVDGTVTSGFGQRRNPFIPSVLHFHKGIDIGAMIGRRFHVARDGLVIYSGRMQGYGNVIFVRHQDGYITVYGHNKVNLVKNGDVVRQGQEIGEVGRTGIATGPHLHFEVRKMDDVINPFVALKMEEVMQVSTETAHR